MFSKSRLLLLLWRVGVCSISSLVGRMQCLLSRGVILFAFAFGLAKLGGSAENDVNGNEESAADTHLDRPISTNTVREEEAQDRATHAHLLNDLPEKDKSTPVISKNQEDQEETLEKEASEGRLVRYFTELGQHLRDKDRWRRVKRRVKGAIGETVGDAVTVIVFLLLLTFAWEFMKAKVLGSPKIVFAPTQLSYDLKVQTVQRLEAASPGVRPVSLVILFANGKGTLRSDQVHDIRTFSVAARYCQAKEVSVVGFASSRPFRSNSDENNKNLANSRASAVVNVLRQSYAEENIHPTMWPTFQEMHAGARIQDGKGTSDRKLALEPLNRRAVLEVSLPDSCLEKTN